MLTQTMSKTIFIQPVWGDKSNCGVDDRQYQIFQDGSQNKRQTIPQNQIAKQNSYTF